MTGKWVTRRARRPAVVLIIVLVAVVVLTLSAYTFSDMMLTHYEAVQLSGRRVQSQALVDSGVDVIRNYLLLDEATRLEMGGSFDNPPIFQAVPIKMDVEPRDQGNVSILVPYVDPDGNLAGVRMGLEDESTRLNLNSLMLVDQVQENGGRTLLMQLPGMTEDVADSIMDWMDPDDEPREFGAEVDYYSALEPSYAPKNGPLESIEELLLVRGVVPELLYGLDSNQNGVLEPHEQNGGMAPGSAGGIGSAGGPMMGSTQSALPADTGLGSLDRGWAGYFTLYSQESNLNSDGLPRIDVNGSDLQALHDALNEVFAEQVATFIVAYRLFGPYTEEGGETGNISVDQLDLTQEPRFPISQVLDLIGVRVQVQADGQNVLLAEAFPESVAEMNGYLPTMMDELTVNPSEVIPGRININQAPRAILAGIPGMTEEIVNQILELRSDETTDPSAQGRDHETWLLTQAVVTLDEMRTLMPFINAGGDVYRAQVVGYFEDGGASARAEVVIDSTPALPRVVFWRDISHLGRGYPLEVLGVRLVDQLQGAVTPAVR